MKTSNIINKFISNRKQTQKPKKKIRVMEMIMKEDVVIVGGGVAGLATALALKRVGVRALVLERSKELRTTGAALTLFPNAWIALEALGVAEKLTKIYAPYAKGNVTNVAKGTTQVITLGTEGINKWESRGPRAVHRRALLEALAEELPTNTIRFSSKLSSIESSSSSMTIIRLEDGTTIEAKVLIGCDGVHSVVARWLGLRDPVHSGRFAVRGLAVFPEGHGFKHEVQQFLDKGRRAGVAPLNDKELYWFLTYQPDDPKTADEELTTGDPKLIQKKVLEDLVGFPEALLNVIRHSDLSTLSLAPLMFRYPWNLIFGHLSKGTVTVAGDSMHPMTPDLGQGGCLALEDAVILGRHIGNSMMMSQHEDVEMVRTGIEMYVKERKWRGAAMITGSYLSGWVQQGGGNSGSDSSGWLLKFIRDAVFYKILFRRILNFVNFDCGKLPTLSSSSPSLSSQVGTSTGTNDHYSKKID